MQRPAVGSPTVEPMSADVDGLVLSGLRCRPVTPSRGRIIALHGGGSTARYWDSPVDRTASLLLVGGMLGWDTIALDRPGYGAALEQQGDGWSVADQAGMVARAATRLARADGPAEHCLVLVGHSLGSLVCMEVARFAADLRLAGIAISGVPAAYTDQQASELLAFDLTSDRSVRPPRGGDPARFYGPVGTWPREVLDRRHGLHGVTPAAEFLDARGAPLRMESAARQLRVPVHWAAAEHEQTTAPAETVLAIARRSVRPDLLSTQVVMGAGHNISLGDSARPYHLTVLAFAEEARRRARTVPDHAKFKDTDYSH